jgi:hypothetical protein
LGEREDIQVFVNAENAGYSGLRSALEHEELKHAEKFGQAKDEWRQGDFKEVSVRVTTFKQLLKEANAPATIDYIALDMEGSELAALSTFPFEDYWVACLSIEGDSCNAILKEKGFTRVTNPFNSEAPWEAYFVNEQIVGSLAPGIDIVERPAK